ncbi:MAG TPA: hypothetical protein VFP84_28475, partial [Kofleriaceae bacterium]|nr:hypothetical protein [Kofleriaceae bacterium]
GVGDVIVGALGDAGAMARRLAYGALADPAAWKTAPLAPGVTVEQELATNLAPIDAIDTGQMINMQTSPGCGNALAFRLPASATSYLALADLLADDQLYLDTSKPTCTVYLALELELASAGDLQHTSCGGRTLRHDALDALLSVVTLGRAGLDPLDAFAPRLRSTATAHPDITDTFPFLAAPNP